MFLLAPEGDSDDSQVVVFIAILAEIIEHAGCVEDRIFRLQLSDIDSTHSEKKASVEVLQSNINSSGPLKYQEIDALSLRESGLEKLNKM